MLLDENFAKNLEEKYEINREFAKRIKEKKEKPSIEGLIIQLKQHVPNIKMGDIKDTISTLSKRLISNPDSKIEHLIKTIANAKASGNIEAVKITTSIMNRYLKDYFINDPLVQERIKNIEDQYKHVTTFRKRLEDSFKMNRLGQDKNTLISWINNLMQQNYIRPWTGTERSTKPLLMEIKKALESIISD